MASLLLEVCITTLLLIAALRITKRFFFRRTFVMDNNVEKNSRNNIPHEYNVEYCFYLSMHLFGLMIFISLYKIKLYSLKKIFTLVVAQQLFRNVRKNILFI